MFSSILLLGTALQSKTQTASRLKEFNCWVQGFSWVRCCHPRWGLAGNEECWDQDFYFTRCCGSAPGLELVDKPQLPLALQRWDRRSVLKVVEEHLWSTGWLDLAVHAGKPLVLISDFLRVVRGEPEVIHIGSVEELPAELAHGAFFVPVFESDDVLARVVDAIDRVGGIFVPPNHVVMGLAARAQSRTMSGHRARFLWTDRHAQSTLASTMDRSSHWNLDVHEAICQVLAATREVAGAYVEIGVYKGGSSVTALQYLQSANIRRRVFLFDTFEGFAYPAAYSSHDRFWSTDNHSLGLSPEQSIHDLQSHLQPFLGNDVYLHIQKLNIIDDDLPPEVAQVAAANIDVDLLEATQAALAKIAPRMPLGGIIHCEDASSTPALSGALIAVERFLNSALGKCFTKLMLTTTIVLVRVLP